MAAQVEMIRELARVHAVDIVRHFYGEPNRRMSNQQTMRWFPHGGFVLNLQSGKWHSFSDDAHGDMADLVVRELGVDQRGAFRWLVDWFGVPDAVQWRVSSPPGGAAAARSGSGTLSRRKAGRRPRYLG